MRTFSVFSISLLLCAFPALSAPLTPEQTFQVVKTVDERQRSGGDYKALMYIESKEKDKADTVREALVLRREADQRLIILFTKPKSEAGKGYLRIDKNLFSYDPSTGAWDRKTERERINGTDSRRADYDQSRLAEEYDAAFDSEGHLGKFETYLINLKVKPGVDVAYPVIKLWVDRATNNVLKREEYAVSGRLLRTSYYPRWEKIFSESKKADVWFPQEMRFFDEVEKANSTVILTRGVDLHPLEANQFTKAWVEGKSR